MGEWRGIGSLRPAENGSTIRNWETEVGISAGQMQQHSHCKSGIFLRLAIDALPHPSSVPSFDVHSRCISGPVARIA